MTAEPKIKQQHAVIIIAFHTCIHQLRVCHLFPVVNNFPQLPEQFTLFMPLFPEHISKRQALEHYKHHNISHITGAGTSISYLIDSQHFL